MPAWTMYVETKFLRLERAVEWGTVIEGWQVCWLGGWDKNRMLFVVMVERVIDGHVRPYPRFGYAKSEWLLEVINVGGHRAYASSLPN